MRWTAYIKQVRQVHGASLDGAYLIASRQPEWRRWVEKQINSDSACRKMALRHIRESGTGALLVQIGDTLKVR